MEMRYRQEKDVTGFFDHFGGLFSFSLKEARIPETDMRELLAGLHAVEPDREVIVRGDRSLSYEKICEVLAILGDVGFTRVGLVTERP